MVRLDGQASGKVAVLDAEDAASGLIPSIPEDAQVPEAAQLESHDDGTASTSAAILVASDNAQLARDDEHNGDAAARQHLDAPEAPLVDGALDLGALGKVQSDAELDGAADLDLSKITADDVTAPGVVVEVLAAGNRLAQTVEWVGGRYAPISWPHILPPDWSHDLDIGAALGGVSSTVRLPDVCINQ
jgi:hypothetical protein